MLQRLREEWGLVLWVLSNQKLCKGRKGVKTDMRSAVGVMDMNGVSFDGLPEA